MFYTNPHLKQQNLTGSFAGNAFATPFNLGGAHVRVTTWAFNVIARYPGERFQLYAGVGLGIFWARQSGNPNGPGTASDMSPGVNLLAGVRYLITPHVGLFTEYKHNRATFNFGGSNPPCPGVFGCVFAKEDYSPHILTVGVSYHF